MIGNLLLNKYKILSELGEGGISKVYLAEHVMLKRKYAVKMLADHLLRTPGFKDRFFKEGLAQAQLQHDNIVQVIDYIEENGKTFLLMDYIEGECLDQLINRKGKLSESVCIQIMSDILVALNFAHKNGVIHRDIKPSNIIISNSGRAKLMDFGIAIMMGDKRMTATGTNIGTSWYMSPEHVTRPKEIDHRSDVYSMGIVLYEMLTGDVPFVGETDFEIKDSHVRKTVLPPIEKISSISIEMNDIVLKALAKNPDERFDGCMDFLSYIKELIEEDKTLENSGITTKSDRSDINKEAKKSEIEKKYVLKSTEIETVKESIKQQERESNSKNTRDEHETYQSTNQIEKKNKFKTGSILIVIVFVMTMSLILVIYQTITNPTKTKLKDRIAPALSALISSEIFIQKGHSSRVSKVCFSPNGKLIISGGADNTFKLWDADSGILLRTFTGHTGWVRSVNFSPDGTRIVSGSDDYTIKLWDAETGKLIRIIDDQSSIVFSVCFSPDGKHILSGDSDCKIKLWDQESGKLIRIIDDGDSRIVSRVIFSQDGMLILSGSGSNEDTIKLWDAKSGELIRTHNGLSAWNFCLNSDGSRIICSGKGNIIKLLDAKSGKLIRTFSGHLGSIYSLSLSPDGTRLLSGSSDKTIKLWNIKSGTLIRTLIGHSSDVTSVCFSPDGTHILSGSSDLSIRLWETESGMTIRSLNGYYNFPLSVCFSPDGYRIISGNIDNIIRLWDTKSGSIIRNFTGHSDSVNAVSFNYDGTRIVSGSSDSTIKLWDVESGTLLKSFEVLKPISGTVKALYRHKIKSVNFSPDGTLIISGSDDNNIRLWNVKTKKLLRTFDGHSGTVNSVVFSPNGTRFISGSYDETIGLWDVKSGDRIRSIFPFYGDTSTVKTVRFSPDGTRIISGYYDNEIKLWNTESGKLIRVFHGHSDEVTSVDFSPDGTHIISASNDHTIKLWDVETGKMVKTFQGHSNYVESVSFSPDGTTILSGSRDNTINLWSIETNQILMSINFLPGNEWLAFQPGHLYYNSSHQGDKWAAIRFENRNDKVFPLNYYKEQLKRTDFRHANRMLQPE